MDKPLPEGTPSLGTRMLTVQISFGAVAGIFALVRAYVKCFMVRKVKLDDYLIFTAMILATVLAAIAIDGIVNGATGKPAALIQSDEARARSLRSWYLAEVLYPPITLLIRGSLCVFLLRLAAIKWHRYVIYLNFIIIAFLSTTFFFILALQCIPQGFFWERAYHSDGRCMNKNIIQYSVIVHAVFSALSDWCLGLLPIAILRHVELNRRTKAAIAVLLSLGIVAGIIILVRLIYVKTMDPSHPEFLYHSSNFGIWSVAEPTLGIVAGCVATFRPLFKKWEIGFSSNERAAPKYKAVARRISNRLSWRGGHDSAAFVPPKTPIPEEEEDVGTISPTRSVTSVHEVHHGDRDMWSVRDSVTIAPSAPSSPRPKSGWY